MMLEAPGKSNEKKIHHVHSPAWRACCPLLHCPGAHLASSSRAFFCTGFELQHSPSAVAASADDDDDEGGGDVGYSFRKPPSPHGTHTRTVYGAAGTLTARRQQTVTMLLHLLGLR